MRTSLFIETERFNTSLEKAIAAFDKAGYNPGQARRGKGPGGGQWTSEGGESSVGSSRSKAAAAYKRKFGHPPPKDMSVNAMKRWTKSSHVSAPRDNDNRSDGEIKVDVKKRLAQRQKDLQSDVDIIKDRGATDAQKTKAADSFNDHARDTWDDLSHLPEQVWYDRTFADEVFSFLTTFSIPQVAIIIGSLEFYGAALGLTGLYLMGRWVGRKIATGGRYAGVRPGT